MLDIWVKDRRTHTAEKNWRSQRENEDCMKSFANSIRFSSSFPKRDKFRGYVMVVIENAVLEWEKETNYWLWLVEMVSVKNKLQKDLEEVCVFCG